MMKNYTFKHAGENYSLSLDRLATRNMDAYEASRHINTDMIMLLDDKRVVDIKQGYQTFKNNGGVLKKKQYLDSFVDERRPGYNWDMLILEAKTAMLNIFDHGELHGWDTPEDHWQLRRLIQSGHAVAAYNAGCALIEQDQPSVVYSLVTAHNNGHVGALYRLSGYLAKKGDFVGAFTCLVISADCGAGSSVVAIPHFETLNYLMKSSNLMESGELKAIIDDLADSLPHSTARYLQLMMLLLNGDHKSIELLSRISSNPQNLLKLEERDEYFQNRNLLLKEFCDDLKSKISNGTGEMLVKDTGELIKIYTEVSSKEQYCFFPYKDFLEVDAIFNP
jgi:hypothetical protein